jgi:hypothetical protein
MPMKYREQLLKITKNTTTDTSKSEIILKATPSLKSNFLIEDLKAIDLFVTEHSSLLIAS